MHKWKHRNGPERYCGNIMQSIEHIVVKYSLGKYEADPRRDFITTVPKAVS